MACEYVPIAPGAAGVLTGLRVMKSPRSL